MEDGVTEPALSKRIGVIRFELGRFTLSRPHPNKKGGWWVVDIEPRSSGGFTSTTTFDGLLRMNPSLNDHIYAWGEAHTDGRVMVSLNGLWFKQEEDAVLFWLTFKQT